MEPFYHLTAKTTKNKTFIFFPPRLINSTPKHKRLNTAYKMSIRIIVNLSLYILRTIMIYSDLVEMWRGIGQWDMAKSVAI